MWRGTGIISYHIIPTCFITQYTLFNLFNIYFISTIKDYTVQTTFILAGASNACAAVCTNPIDVVKIRMQCDAGSERKYPGLVKGLIKVNFKIEFKTRYFRK